MRRLWLSIGLVACGDNTPPEAPDPADGTRLHLRHYVYDDGTEQPSTTEFFDTSIGVPCTATKWSDGHTYCTPHAGLETAFIDAACQQTVGVVRRQEPPPSCFEDVYSSGGVTGVSRLFARRELLPALPMYRLSAGNCLLADASGVELYAVEEIDRSELVRLERRLHVDDGSELVVTLLTSDDGVQIPIGLGTRELDTCVVDPFAADQRCVPPAAVAATYYFDDACSAPEASMPESTSPDALISTRDDAGCLHYYRQGTHHASSPLYQRIDGSCRAVESTDYFLFEVGHELELPTVEREQRTAGTRLRPTYLRDGSLTVLDPAMFDTELGELCVTGYGGPKFQTLSCIPAFASQPQVYGDPECKGTIHVGEADARCGMRVDFVYDGSSKRVFRLGDPVEVAYARDPNGACVRYTPQAGYRMRAFTTVVDWSSFATATLR